MNNNNNGEVEVEVATTVKETISGADGTFFSLFSFLVSATWCFYVRAPQPRIAWSLPKSDNWWSRT